MKSGYNIFQVRLSNPNMEYEWEATPIAWALMWGDAKHLLEYLNEHCENLYFFITKKG